MTSPHYDRPTEPSYTNADKAASPMRQIRDAGDAVRNLVSQFSDLIRQEMMLARAEMSEAAGKVKTGVIAIATGFILALAALIVLLNAIVIALANVMAPWLAATIVGVVVLIVAAIFIAMGQSRLSATSLAPTRTAENVQRDANMIKDNV